jgi:hypothetical protein
MFDNCGMVWEVECEFLMPRTRFLCFSAAKHSDNKYGMCITFPLQFTDMCVR